MFGDLIGSIGGDGDILGLGFTNDTARECTSSLLAMLKMLVFGYCVARSFLKFTFLHRRQIGSSPPLKTPDLDNTRNR